VIGSASQNPNERSKGENMKLRRLALACVMATAVALALPSAKAQAANLPVSGTTTNGLNLTGVLNLTNFVRNNGVLSAVGTLTGTLTDAAGNVLGSVTNLPVTLPVLPQQSTGTCQILDLVLGPLHLDLLGLVVDLNQVHLTITAQQGPGNLLGNLLCAVANLLNHNALNVNGLAGLLNNILRHL
jgi:hypothetical protein